MLLLFMNVEKYYVQQSEDMSPNIDNKEKKDRSDPVGIRVHWFSTWSVVLSGNLC
jgi:hypothetical protein